MLATESPSAASTAAEREATGDNRYVAKRLGEYADLLEMQAANPFRARG